MTSNPAVIVVALGGNALSPPGERVTIHDQFRHTRTSLDVIVELVRAGWRVIIVHGNGPQVGKALARNELARHVIEPLPFGVLVASTAGWIGYMIQQSLQNALRRSGLDREVVTVITQTVVSEIDPALSRPSKPIGNVLQQAEVEALAAEGTPVGQDRSGRLRRLAPSPRPVEIIEHRAIRRLLDDGVVVIAAGGGGPPVWRGATGCEGLDAVVDKDLTAAVLGQLVEAHTLLILTDVDGVYEGWGTESPRLIHALDVARARAMVTDGAVGTGTMGPKLEAAVQFVEGGGQRAVIGHLGKGVQSLKGESGTTVTRE